MGIIGIRKQGELKKEIRNKEAEKALLLRYIRNLENGWKLSGAMAEQRIGTLAICGCNEYSDIVFEALKDSECRLEYIITGNLSVTSKDITLLTMEEKLPEVDAVMICELFQEEDRKRELIEKGFRRVITFSDVIYGKR